MTDVDIYNKTNDNFRFSSDQGWMKFPLILEGPFIWGRNDDGSPRLGRNEGHPVAVYNPWSFSWSNMLGEYLFLSSHSLLFLFPSSRLKIFFALIPLRVVMMLARANLPRINMLMMILLLCDCTFASFYSRILNISY